MILSELKNIIIDKDLSDIEKLQDEYIKKNVKYKQIFLYEENGLSKEVHEYLRPNGSVGYQTILRKIIDGKKYIMSKGYGEEAESRTYDWKEEIFNF